MKCVQNANQLDGLGKAAQAGLPARAEPGTARRPLGKLGSGGKSKGRIALMRRAGVSPWFLGRGNRAAMSEQFISTGGGLANLHIASLSRRPAREGFLASVTAEKAFPLGARRSRQAAFPP